MQQRLEEQRHGRGTSPAGGVLPLRQALTNPTEGNNWTKPARFPDFFLIGAPRCGTTSLSRYLAGNPQVCFSRPKEPHYFSLLTPRASLANIETAYLARYFSHYRDGHKAIGEGSVSYLYSPYALPRILGINTIRQIHRDRPQPARDAAIISSAAAFHAHGERGRLRHSLGPAESESAG